MQQHKVALRLCTWRVSVGHFDVVEHLLLAGADKNATTQDNSTALDLSAENGHKKLAQLLLEFGLPFDDDHHVEVQLLERVDSG